MLILATNDDGVYSPGLTTLAKALKELGDVYVVAPDREQSAVSHALTLHRPLLVEPVMDRVFSVNGTPTDCVNIAVGGLLPRMPDIVVSGINKGGNLGDDVTYSGTVSAAFEAALMGIPAIAVSMVARQDFIFQGAAEFAARLARVLLDKGMGKDTLLNVNVPNLPPAEIKGVKVTRQGRRIWGGSVLERIDPRGKKYFWIGGEVENWIDSPDADHEAVKQGYISVTPLKLDLTDDDALGVVRGWGELG
ncbi:MAG: 5'/3'-nucleotidase SurE [Nitrospirae bacterium]|nr:5'/3'-nucleotidase SurE [Nitrospirota bacterium]